MLTNRVTYEQSLKIVEMLTKKIKKEVFHKTSVVYEILSEIMSYSNGKVAAIKDPGHVANIKAIVGQ